MAVYANLTIDQGTDFRSTITVEDSVDGIVNLTGYTAVGQVRKTYNSTTSYDFTTQINNPTLGELIIILPNTITANMKPGRYVYDVEITSPTGTVTRVVEGQVEITPRVTRSS